MTTCGPRRATASEASAWFVCNDYAFAGGQAVGLDDNWKGKVRDLRARASGWDACSLKKLLSEKLGAFQPGRGLRRTYDSEITPPEHVDDSGHERSLGADDGQVDPVERSQFGIGVRFRRRGDTVSYLTDAWVPGASEKLGAG